MTKTPADIGRCFCAGETNRLFSCKRKKQDKKDCRVPLHPLRAACGGGETIQLFRVDEKVAKRQLGGSPPSPPTPQIPTPHLRAPSGDLRRCNALLRQHRCRASANFKPCGTDALHSTNGGIVPDIHDMHKRMGYTRCYSIRLCASVWRVGSHCMKKICGTRS